MKWALLSVGVVVALLVGAYALSARWPIPQAQQQALAQLRQPRARAAGGVQSVCRAVGIAVHDSE
nr:hypothetical protein VDP59_014615 [Xanthomonas campestris pv. campestris]